jgi:pyridoxamine 5'-phosphate oxidase family protein
LFTEKEIAYLKSQQLARIGTSSKSGRPDVAPVSFDADSEYVYVSGRDLTFVVDDLKTMKPWAPRGIKMQGTADIVKHTGYMGPGTYIRIKPVNKRSWNI